MEEGRRRMTTYSKVAKDPNSNNIAKLEEEGKIILEPGAVTKTRTR